MAKPGRPRVSAEPNEAVCVKVPVSLYDRAYEKADRDRVTVPELIRRALAKDLEIQNRRTTD